MAKERPELGKRPDPSEALQKLEQPKVKVKAIATIVVVFVLLWATAIGLEPWAGIAPIIIVGVLTVVAVGFALYLWRLTRKSSDVVNLLKGATDAAGREAALSQLREERLAKGGGGDAMKALAEAQLLAQEQPSEAIRVLEQIDLKKAPAMVQDDIRANLALLYLMNNRPKDAKPLVEEMRLDRQQQAQAKAMYAAVMAETYARTGAPEEALKLLETYDPDSGDYGEMTGMLYRAQVYAYYAAKKRGQAKTAMHRMARQDINLVAAFVVKGRNPELKQMAKQLLQKSGAIPKQKMQIMR